MNSQLEAAFNAVTDVTDSLSIRFESKCESDRFLLFANGVTLKNIDDDIRLEFSVNDGGGCIFRAVFDKTITETFPAGDLAQKKEETAVSIYYNEGENAIQTSHELTQLVGYYADSAALEESASTVLALVKELPVSTPVMIDVKSPKGAFYYSSSISNKRDSYIDTATMDQLIAYLDDSQMYAIARLPALRDYEYGLNHVSDGLPTAGGYLWADEDYCYWLNPSSQGTITYLISIVAELKALGFDEVVFDDFYFPETDKIVLTATKIKPWPPLPTLC